MMSETAVFAEDWNNDGATVVTATYRRSSEISELFVAKAKAQLGIENATKDAENPHFKSKYATLAAVSDACLHPLAEQGISVWQFPANSSDDSLSVTTLFGHASGQWIENTLSVRLSKMDAQGVGLAITYLRRYALAAFAMVAPEDDDGNAAAAAAPQRQIDTPTVKSAHPAVVARDRILAAINAAKTPAELTAAIDGPSGAAAETLIRAAKGGEDAWNALIAHKRIKLDELEAAIKREGEKPFFFALQSSDVVEFSDPDSAADNYRGYLISEQIRAGEGALEAAWKNGAQMIFTLRERGFDDLADSCVRTYEIEFAKARNAEAEAEKAAATKDKIPKVLSDAEVQERLDKEFPKVPGEQAPAGRVLDEMCRMLDETPGNVAPIDDGVPILAAALQEKIKEKTSTNFKEGLRPPTPTGDGAKLYPEKAGGPYDVVVPFKGAAQWFAPAKAKLNAMLDGDRHRDDFKRFRSQNAKGLQALAEEMPAWKAAIEKLIVAGETKKEKP